MVYHGTLCVISEYYVEEVQNLYLFREAIEVGIIRSVAEHSCSPGYLSKLRQILSVWRRLCAGICGGIVGRPLILLYQVN